jgi:hypothetical protein
MISFVVRLRNPTVQGKVDLLFAPPRTARSAAVVINAAQGDFANSVHPFLAKINSFCEARFAGLSPWFAPVRGGGLHFGLVRRALCIFAPRSTPNELPLIAVTLFSQGRVAAWPLAVAAEDRQHAIHHCLGSRAALLASPGPISPRSHYRRYKQYLVAGWAPSEGCRLLAGHLLARFVLL